MKRLLMLKPCECASGDTFAGNIYDIIQDSLIIHKTIEEDGEMFDDTEQYEYNKVNIEKYSEFEQDRWITIKDESSKDDFQIYENDDRFIIFENDKELAHELIERIEGLDSTIVNMALYFKNRG